MRRGIGHRLFSFGNRRNEASGRRPSKRSWQRRGQVETLEGRQVLAAVPVISEVLASNDRTIDDVDGDDSDYIELYNAGDDDMSLNRWYLTDNPNDLQKWRFPDVPLKAGEFLVVFASNKDRNDPAANCTPIFSCQPTASTWRWCSPMAARLHMNSSRGSRARLRMFPMVFPRALN